MLHCLIKHKKLCLPFLIFQYLRHMIIKSRTTTAGEGKKVPHYIPFGRIPSEILVENGLVDALKDAQCTDELVASTGDTFDAKNLKNMGVLKEVVVDPVSEDPKEVLKKRMMVEGYPLWTNLDSPVALALHIFTLQQEGIDTSSFRYEDLPDCPPDMVPMKKEKKRNKKRKTEGDESKQKQPKKPKNAEVFGLSTYSEPLEKGTYDISTSGISISGVNTTLLSSTSRTTKPFPTSFLKMLLKGPQNFWLAQVPIQKLSKPLGWNSKIG